MVIKKDSLRKFFLATSFFMAFAGFYVVLLILAKVGLKGEGRFLTVPIRLLIVGFLLFAFLLRAKIKIRNALVFFLSFSALYYLRIVIEIFDTTGKLSMPEVEFFLYFTSFFFLPLFFISQLRLKDKDYNIIFFSIIFSSVLLAILSIAFYKDFIGLGRISQVTDQVQTINPLALSYSSALAIGLIVNRFLTRKVEGKAKLILSGCLLLSLVPFFLGASRGSIIALFFPILFYLVYKKGLKNKIYVIFLLGLLALVFIIATQYLGDYVFNRLFSTTSRALETGSPRIAIWRDTIIQFSKNPLFGNSLETETVMQYPHNIFLEVLITTGIVGFIPFVIFIIFLFKKSVKIARHNPKYFFLVVIFLQGFSARMFSGSLYTGSWLAIGAGLVVGYSYKRYDR